MVGIEEATLTVTPQELCSLLSDLITLEANIWFYFVKCRVMPIRHNSSITNERVLLLLCLLEGKSIDVWKVIHREIIQCASKRLAVFSQSYRETLLAVRCASP